MVEKTNSNTVEPPHNDHLENRTKWPLLRGGLYWEAGVYYNNFFSSGLQHVYCANFMLTVSHNGNPIII